MRHRTLPLAALALSACTLNVRSIDHSLTAESGGAVEAVSFDATSDSGALDETRLLVRGGARTSALATARLGGLRAADAGADDWSAFVLAWVASGTDASQVTLDYRPPVNDLEVWTDELALDVPADVQLTMEAASESIEATGLTGMASLATRSGSIEFDGDADVDLSADSGSIHARIGAGSLATTSGSIDVQATGSVIATARSGSIDATFDRSGRFSTTSGSVSARLLAGLDSAGVDASATSGSVSLRVPSGVAMTLDLAADGGSVSVEVGTVRQSGSTVLVDIAGGGPRVRIRTDSGSISVSEARVNGRD